MDQYKSEAAMEIRAGLPVAMAKNPAAIRRIYLDDLSGERKAEGGTGKIIADNGLNMAIPQATPGRKCSEPGGHVASR